MIVKRDSAPKCLSPRSRALWRQLIAEFVIDDSAGRALLEQALLALDRAEEARRRIDQDGPAVADRFGVLRRHPLLSTERDNRAAFLQAMKLLALDPGVSTMPKIGRPPGSRGGGL